MLNKDFLWGASTSAYQVEGAWNEDGKTPSIQDIRQVPAGTSDFKVASDHYHHYKEDVALMAEMGLKAYRFSIAWTRIMPNGRPNPEGITFYRNLINELKAHNIEPLVTVFHFDLPADLAAAGGWNNRATIDAFVQYCDLLFALFGQDVKYWQTINEQNMLTLASKAIAGDKKTWRETFQANHHMLVAQARVFKHYHDAKFPGKIGPAPNITAIYPASQAPEDQLAAAYMSAFRNWLYLDVPVFGRYDHMAWEVLKGMDAEPEITDQDRADFAAGRADYIAFNYYGSGSAEAPGSQATSQEGDQQTGLGIAPFFRTVENPTLPKSEFGWPIDPVGFRMTAHELYSRYHLPLLVTENGLGGQDVLTEDGKVHDDYRIDYLRQHIEQMQVAVDEGVPFIGYCPWSAIDLISTHEGFRKRYGFVYVNRTDDDLLDLKRYRKDSFYWYQQVIQANGVKA